MDDQSQELKEKLTEYMELTHPNLWKRFNGAVSFPLKDFALIVFDTKDAGPDLEQFKEIVKDFEYMFRNQA